MITAPGIYRDIDALEYHSDPCPAPSLSSTIAKKLVSASAMHAFCEHPKLGGANDGVEDDSDPSASKAKVLG